MTATVAAVVAFAHPETGVWRRGERRVLPVDVAVPLVDAGYVDPVWDALPAATAAAAPVHAVTTVYDSSREVDGDPGQAHASAPDAGEDFVRGTSSRRPRGH